MIDPNDLWRFWFEELSREAWFQPDPAVDAACAERFGALPDLATRGAFADWRATPQGSVALVLAMDQLPRNLWRGTAQAFAYDARALEEAGAAIERGLDGKLSVDERLFLYLPFEHSESLADQDRSCVLIEALGDATYTDYAARHREVIRRFGRFPHRNAALGRTSTTEELAYLAQPGAGF